MFVLSAPLFCLRLTCGPEDPVAPTPDECDEPAMARVTTVEIGGADEPFLAWTHGGAAHLTRGPQGGLMIGIVIRLSGAELPSCLAQETSVLNAARDTLVLSRTPLHTYEQPDGSRMTRVHWLVFEAREPAVGDTLSIRAVFASTTTEHTVVVR